jgi:membrane protease YdiL (CAAX protease family)
MQRSEATRTGLGLIAAHNLAQNTILNRRGYVESNLVVLAGLLSIGKMSGRTLSEMGMSLKVDRTDLRIFGTLAALTAGGSVAALAHPRTRRLLRDERARDSSRGEIAYKSLIRFPIGTALFEEATFRGVLPALVGQPNATGDLLSAGVFGLWHLIPTARALPGSPLSQEMTLVDRAKVVMAGCTATTLAGIGFSWLRRRSGSIVLPWLVHSAFNTLTYLAGVFAWRFARRPSGRSS